MIKSRSQCLVLVSGFLVASLLVALPAAAEVDLGLVELPEGFSISVYAEGLKDARSIAMSDSGVLYVGTRRQGDVYAVVDTDGDGVAETRHVIATELGMPNGIAWRDGALYVAELTRIVRYDGIDDSLESPPEPTVIVDGLRTSAIMAGSISSSDPTGGSTRTSAVRAMSVTTATRLPRF